MKPAGQRDFYVGEKVLFKRHGKETQHTVRKVLHDKDGPCYLVRPPVQPGLSRMWIRHDKLTPLEGADMRDPHALLKELNPSNWKRAPEVA